MKATKPRTYTLDIMGLLSRMNDPNEVDIYSTLNDTEKKGFAPLIVMRWLSGTSDERQILMLNEFANAAVYPLAKHTQLLMQLLQVCNSKIPRNYFWLSQKGSKKTSYTHKIVGEYFEMSQREVRLLNPFPTNQEILRMAEDLGYDKTEITKLTKELNL